MGTIKTTNIQSITGSGTVTIGQSGETISIPSGVTFTNSGVMSGQNYPAFEASVSADQTITSATWTVAACDTVEYDTNSCYNNSTYRFTPTVAGKYLVYGFIYGQCSSVDSLSRVIIALTKNGSRTVNASMETNSTSRSNVLTPSAKVVYDLNGSTDYVQLEGYVQITAGNAQISGAANQRSYFGAYRIGS